MKVPPHADAGAARSGAHQWTQREAAIGDERADRGHIFESKLLKPNAIAAIVSMVEMSAQEKSTSASGGVPEGINARKLARTSAGVPGGKAATAIVA